MLKQRVITAFALALAFVGILFYMPWFVFSIALGGVLLIAAWEWANLSGLQRLWARLFYVVSISLVCLYCVWLTDWTEKTGYFRAILIVACSWWALSLLWIRTFPASAAIWGTTPVRLLMGPLVLIPAWLSSLYLRTEPSGAWLMLLVVLLVSAADIGAYFTGKALGKRKLAPEVSPGKSWEGVFGGAILALVIAMAFNLLVAGNAWLSLFVIVVPTALVSVVGDLLESMVKRYRGVKDSSQLLPGHGGVLDRIDGLVAAIPVFALAFMSTHWRI